MSSETFLGGQSENISQEYTQRQRYLHLANQYTPEYPLLNTVQNRRFYGFVDKDYHVVQPNASDGDEHIVLFGDYASGVQGLNFVVELFNEFRDYYLDLVSRTGLTLPAEIATLTPSRCFEDLDTDFDSYMTMVSQQTLEYILEKAPIETSGLISFSSYLELVQDLMFSDSFSPTLGIHTMTKSGFLLSNRSSVQHTGIYIDLLADADVQIDERKQQFLNNEHFKCYVEKAWEYGFYVDSNCPWRLILNLDSRKVKENILNISQTDRILLKFDDFYSDQKLIKVGLGDYWQMKEFLQRIYIDYYTEVQELTNPESPESLDLNAVLSVIPESTWIELFVLARLRELGVYNSVHYNIRSSEDDLSEAEKTKQDLTNGAISRYNRSMSFRFLNPEEDNLFGLTGPSGALGFIEAKCCEILRDMILKAQISFNERERNRDVENISVSGVNYVSITNTRFQV